ncbi:ROK family transcriptional regulator [Georgenia sp. M64]|uniref:ROK family transcriptional regulator n=1 Tax=Georgenia sp. M64 TaxID=3120520 RepID=UPI0030E2C0EB
MQTTSGSPTVPEGRRTTPFVAAGGLVGGRLRISAKVLPGQARPHNRALILQTLYRDGTQSRADLARSTGLTRVTVSDLVADLLADGLVAEVGPRGGSRPGKPATLLEFSRDASHIVGIDLSDHSLFRGAVLDLGGQVLSRAEVELDGATGTDALERVATLVAGLLGQAGRRVLGIGVGSPGIVDLAGVVMSAPNLGWHDLNLRAALEERFSLPVVVANDANVAVLAEHSFGGASEDTLLVKIGHGVGAGLLLGGSPVIGSRFAAGEVGHVVVDEPGGGQCACGKTGCLETWLATARLTAALEEAGTAADREVVLARAGQVLGRALAPIVGALNISEIVLSGPAELLEGRLSAATIEAIRLRTLAELHGDLELRMTALGDEIVTRGAAALVLTQQLGIS